MHWQSVSAAVILMQKKSWGPREHWFCSTMAWLLLLLLAAVSDTETLMLLVVVVLFISWTV